MLMSVLFLNLRCNNSVRVHQIIVVLGTVLIHIKCTIGLYKLTFELYPFLHNLSHMDSHTLSPFDSDLKA